MLGTTGLESAEVTLALTKPLTPSCVVAVDALASRSMSRLCTTIQISNTGIAPGSGVGNHRHPLDESALGVPVIAVGVPTVVEAATLAADLLEEAGQGSFHPAALQGESANVVVTLRDIDQRVRDMAKLVAWGLNLALQPGLSMQDLDMLLS